MTSIDTDNDSVDGGIGFPGEKTSDSSTRTYADIMREEALKREKEETFIPLAHLCQRDTIFVLAKIVAALKLIGGTLPEHTFLFLGAEKT
ncbi:hypothetical protein RYX36_030530 [Vicia faba]